MGTTSAHSEIIYIFQMAIIAYLLNQRVGRLYVETTFIMPEADRNNWVKGSRIPDMMFYTQERYDAYIAQTPDYKNYPLALVPDLVVEVISPTDNFSDVDEKLSTYLRDGVKVLWLADPRRKVLTIQRASGDQIIRLSGDDLLTDDLLPGFAIRTVDLFA